MRSELINEIFSVETEAEQIVHDAQVKGRELVSRAQREGTKALHEATEKAYEQGDATIAKAQEKSEARIIEAEKNLWETEAQKVDLDACADSIAKKLVDLLCSTKIGELAE